MTVTTTRGIAAVAGAGAAALPPAACGSSGGGSDARRPPDGTAKPAVGKDHCRVHQCGSRAGGFQGHNAPMRSPRVALPSTSQVPACRLATDSRQGREVRCDRKVTAHLGLIKRSDGTSESP